MKQQSEAAPGSPEGIGRQLRAGIQPGDDKQLDIDEQLRVNNWTSANSRLPANNIEKELGVPE